MATERIRAIYRRLTGRGVEQQAPEAVVTPEVQPVVEPTAQPIEPQQELSYEQIAAEGDAFIERAGGIGNAIRLMELMHDIETFKSGQMSPERYEETKRELDEIFDLRGRHGKRKPLNEDQTSE